MRIMHDPTGALYYALDNEEVKFLGELLSSIKHEFPTGADAAFALKQTKTTPRAVDLLRLETDMCRLRAAMDLRNDLPTPDQFEELRTSIEALNQRLYELNSEYGAF